MAKTSSGWECSSNTKELESETHTTSAQTIIWETLKSDSYHFEPWKGGNKHHIQLFKNFSNDSHQLRTFPESAAFLE